MTPLSASVLFVAVNTLFYGIVQLEVLSLKYTHWGGRLSLCVLIGRGLSVRFLQRGFPNCCRVPLG